MKSLINSDAVKNQIARALPTHLTPDRFLRVATTTLLRVPKLAECSQESFMKAMLDCSSLGLEPDGRRCHLIPYGKEVQLIIDWKGLVELAKRSGDVALWKPETVKENDQFDWVNGEIRHSVDWRKDRGALQCVYSLVKLKNGETDTEVMTLEEVKAIQKRSKAANNGPWKTDFEEMAKKTVMRRHSKRLTLSPEFHDALEKDSDKIDFAGMRNVTPRNEELTTNENPFDKIEKAAPSAQTEPPTLADLMERDEIPEPDLLLMLADAGVCSAETAGIDDLSADQIEHTVADWDRITKEGAK